MKIIDTFLTIKSLLSSWGSSIHWPTLAVWFTVALVLGTCRRLGSIKAPRRVMPLMYGLSVLHLLGIPLIAAAALWAWWRVGFPVLWKTWFAAAVAQLLLEQAAGWLIRLRNLDMPQIDLQKSLGNLVFGPLGLTGTIHRIIVGLTPKCGRGGLTETLVNHLEALTGPGSDFAKANAQLIELEAGALNVEQCSTLLTRPYVAEPVQVGDFRHLDLGFYQGFMDHLQAFNFAYAGDYEVTSLRMPGLQRTFVRTMMSPDRTVLASCFHVLAEPRLKLPPELADNRGINFETEFVDGSFVVTANDPSAAHFDHGQDIDQQSFANLSLDALGQRHYERVAAHSQSRQTCQVLLQSVDELHAMQTRLTDLKRRMRPQDGISKQEVQKITQHYFKGQGSQGYSSA
jgi:hypothetical protein